MKRLVDLSHTIENGLVTYKGLPAPIICDYLSREDSKSVYEEGTTFQIGTIEMCTNTGTYLDSPFHRYQEGKDLSDLELEQLVGLKGVLISTPQGVTKIDAHYFKTSNVRGKAVLVHTGWSRYWNTDKYYENHPFLTEDAAEYLMKNGAVLVGIDSYNIDDTNSRARPVHSILLGAEILIVEHLCCLNLIPQSSFRFYAVPIKIKGAGTFPVRAFAEISSKES